MGSQDNVSNTAVEIEAVNNEVATAEVETQKTDAGDAKVAQPEGSRFDHIKETLELLYKLFPNAFIKEGNCKPLKIGIFADLRAAIEGRDDVTITKVRAALSFYTSRLRYLFSLKEGAKRVGLNGEEGEVVSKEHADFAKAKFDEINSKRKVNNKPKKAPRRFNKPNAQGPKANFAAKGKNNFKKNDKKPQSRPIPGRKADLSELSIGTQVLVVSSESHFVRGSVAELNGTSVAVTLHTGMTVSLPLDRIMIPTAKQD